MFNRGVNPELGLSDCTTTHSASLSLLLSAVVSWLIVVKVFVSSAVKLMAASAVYFTLSSCTKIVVSITPLDAPTIVGPVFVPMILTSTVSVKSPKVEKVTVSFTVCPTAKSLRAPTFNV